MYKYYQEKGETHPDYYQNSRDEVLNYLMDYLSGQKKLENVLELGCGSGMFAEKLKKSCSVSNYVGIELHQPSAELAKEHLDKVITGDIEKVLSSEDLKNEVKYDLIICLDILEHLMDPWTVLDKIAEMSSKDAVILCSVPNASHINILFALLTGNFIYNKKGGQFDITHIRWFTKKTLSSLIGKHFNKSMVIKNTINKGNYNLLYRPIIFIVKHLFKQLYAYQYIVLSRKTN